LLEDIGNSFDSKQYTAAARESVVISLANLGVADPTILNKAADLVQNRKFTRTNSITNVLYALAKLHFTRADKVWLIVAFD
jgi:hypothetical protein